MHQSPLKVNLSYSKKKNAGLRLQLMSMRRRETLFLIDDLTSEIQYIQLTNTDQYAHMITCEQDCTRFLEIPDRIEY